MIAFLRDLLTKRISGQFSSIEERALASLFITSIESDFKPSVSNQENGVCLGASATSASIYSESHFEDLRDIMAKEVDIKNLWVDFLQEKSLPSGTSSTKIVQIVLETLLLHVNETGKERNQSVVSYLRPFSGSDSASQAVFLRTLQYLLKKNHWPFIEAVYVSGCVPESQSILTPEGLLLQTKTKRVYIIEDTSDHPLNYILTSEDMCVEKLRGSFEDCVLIVQHGFCDESFDRLASISCIEHLESSTLTTSNLKILE